MIVSADHDRFGWAPLTTIDGQGRTGSMSKSKKKKHDDAGSKKKRKCGRRE
jgi:hypothetical protein